jgi:hypothetical protein
MYCELCGSPSHNTNQCKALDALVEILDRYAFRVNEGPQGLEGVMEEKEDTREDELIEEDQFTSLIMINGDTW